jgi:Transport and Golgi organisation 2
MCSVTFIPLHNKVFIAHNRDESSGRAKAIAPQKYNIKDHELLFPKDSTAGGTWIASTINGNAAVLLNGAFEKHIHQPPYRKSRGLAFLDIVAADDLYLSYCNADLTGIEPFTVILWSNDNLYECRWDGEQKNIIRLEASASHTWSSVTLYDEAIILKRKTWFRHWLREHPAASMDEIIQFHLSAGDGDAHNNFRMNRDGKILTVSITAMEIRKDKSIVKYLDLQDNTVGTSEILFTKAAAIQ